MTDPPVTLSPPAGRSPLCLLRIPLYIEEGVKPEIGRFAMALSERKR